MMLSNNAVKCYSIWDPEGGGLEELADPPSHFFIFVAKPLYISYFPVDTPSHVFFTISLRILVWPASTM